MKHCWRIDLLIHCRTVVLIWCRITIDKYLYNEVIADGLYRHTLFESNEAGERMLSDMIDQIHANACKDTEIFHVGS